METFGATVATGVGAGALVHEVKLQQRISRAAATSK
jgi:hypothetical protein